MRKFELKKILFWRKKQSPIPTECRNCGTKVQGPYCHMCGQYLFAGTGKKFWELIYNSMDTVFAFDNKMLVTIQYLLFSPGKLSKEYVNGHIARYVHPSKLFWFVSLFFFALVSIHVSDLNDDLNEPEEVKMERRINEIKEKHAQTVDSAEKQQLFKQISVMDSMLRDTAYINERNRVDKSEFTRKQALTSTSITYSPYLTFLLIPVFAFLLYLSFRKRMRYYADNMVFAIHFHTFIYVWCSLIFIFHKVFPVVDSTDNMVLYLTIPFVYFIVGIFVFYKPRIIPAILKIINIVFLYGIILFVFLIGGIILFALISGAVSWKEFVESLD